VPNTSTLRRTIRSLPEPALRVAWLTRVLEASPPIEVAPLIDTLLREGERGEPAALEATLTLGMVLVSPEHPDLARKLADASEGTELFSLRRMTRGARAEDRRPTTERPALVPDYGAGRELTLGERRSLARRPNRRAFEQLLADPHPLVTRLLLENPRMTESDVVRLASQRPAHTSTLLELARSPRWLSRQRVRLTLMLNPSSPPSLSIPLVVPCTRPELRTIARGTDIPLILRATALELLERRLPVPEPPPHLRVLQ
jgi:hypothetical protein